MANTQAKTLKNSSAVAQALHQFLSDSYATLIITQNFHWNIEGENFYGLHKLSEGFYEEQFTAIDEIAERIRALGEKVATSLEIFNKESKIKHAPTVEGMIAAQEELAASAQKLIDVAGDNEDKGSEDLGVRRIQVHQKNAWMLKSAAK